jgi:hypothetical protein
VFSVLINIRFSNVRFLDLIRTKMLLYFAHRDRVLYSKRYVAFFFWNTYSTPSFEKCCNCLLRLVLKRPLSVVQCCLLEFGKRLPSWNNVIKKHLDSLLFVVVVCVCVCVCVCACVRACVRVCVRVAYT